MAIEQPNRASKVSHITTDNSLAQEVLFGDDKDEGDK